MTYHFPLQTETTKKTATVKQPETVVAPVEAPEKEDKKTEVKTDEQIRDKIEMNTEQKNGEMQ